MNRVDFNYEMGWAIVTPFGLQFGEQFFTNAALVRNRWFERARTEQNWYVPVLFNKDNRDQIILCNINDFEIAISINTDLASRSEEVDLYHQRLQGVIEELKKHKSNYSDSPDK